MLNGINIPGLEAAKEAIVANPSAGAARYGVALNWEHGTRMSATALDMHVGDEKISRDFQWTIDEPPQLLGNSTGPTPQEYLMSGVAACIMVGFAVNASAAGVKLDGLSIRMEGGLDLAGFLNLRPDARIEMGGLKYEIVVAADADRATLEEIARKAYQFSPNAMTVANGIAIEGTLKVLPSSGR